MELKKVTGYHAPITGNFVCDDCGAYCSCNEDLATCVRCESVGHYQEMFAVSNFDYACYDCFGWRELATQTKLAITNL